MSSIHSPVSCKSKVDKLTDAVGKLILFEERQATQGERIGSIEAKISVHDSTLNRVDRKIDQWVNRGIGAWAAAAVRLGASSLDWVLDVTCGFLASSARLAFTSARALARSSSSTF